MCSMTVYIFKGHKISRLWLSVHVSMALLFNPADFFFLKQRQYLRSIHPLIPHISFTFVHCCYVIHARDTTNRFPDQCLNGTPNAADYHQQSHTGGHTCDDAMDGWQCLICTASSDWMSGRTVGKKRVMVPFCH